MKRHAHCLAFIALFAATSVLGAATIENSRSKITTEGASAFRVVSVAGSEEYAVRFLVQRTTEDPHLALRLAQMPGRNVNYNVSSWLTGGGPASTAAPRSAGHVADGFDPAADRETEANRTEDAYAAADGVTLVATGVKINGRRIEWTFPQQKDFDLTADLELPADGSDPALTFHFTPRSRGWYSIAYIGAPEAQQDQIQDLWQPLIWQDKRMPDRPYLTESYRAPLPTTLVQSKGVTIGVLASPEELPFQPLPTRQNSGFGITLRTEEGTARPTIFAPILGGAGSRMDEGKPFSFSMLLIQRRGNVAQTYRDLALHSYGVRDYRKNVSVTLNTTFENMIDYAMGPFARFDEKLRGSAYETDVPGSVKNISALQPLGIALITDNPEIYSHRAVPMMEYGMSREKFLFTIHPDVKGQGASNKLDGPCMPISELTALYSMTGNRTPFFLDNALALLDKPRALNLDDPSPTKWWGDRLALYRATGESRWLDEAKSLADDYLKERVDTPQVDFSSKLDAPFFWTGFVPRWMQLFELWQQTGERRYLDAAHETADKFTEFIWMDPVIPSGDVLVNQGGVAPSYRQGEKYTPIRLPEEKVAAWRLSEIGLTPESSATSKGHRGIFLATHAPYFLKIAAATNDPFLKAIGRDAIIGRYTSFPGYHINTARSTFYEKPDFPLHPLSVLDASTSLHYNHIWPHIALIADYLVADVETRSHNAIHFPSEFAEGYGYVSTEVYGDKPGEFYGDKNVWLWMPKQLATPDDIQLNYIAGRGANSLYLAFTNQSDQPVKTTIHLNASLLALSQGVHPLRIWKENGPAAHASLHGGSFPISVAAHGITAVAVDGVKVQTRFQNTMEPSATARPWKKDFVALQPFGVHAMLINMGEQWWSAYIYSQASADKVKDVTLEYNSGGSWKSVADADFPFEFTIPLEPSAKSFQFRVIVRGADGKTTQVEGELHP